MEKIEVTGKTVEEALINAALQLETSSDNLEYEVIEKGSNGLFGFINSKPAKILVSKKQEENAEIIEEITVEETEEVKPEKVVDKGAVEDKIRKFLNDIFKTMDLEVTIEISFNDDESIDINLIGGDMGVLIGKRGQTLDSLQYLISLVANKEGGKYFRVKLDTENYRERRKATLESLAKNIAYKVKRTRRPVSLEPMNPYERRIIHTSVQKVNGAISWSEGENANRHVVIGPDPKAKPVRRNGGYNNRGRGGRRPYSANRSEHNTPANPDRKPLNEGGATGLYGRIDK